MEHLVGFDVSFYQNDAFYNSILPNASFIIHKVSEQTFRDPKGVGRLKVLDKRMPAAAYHLIKPNKHKWEDEFRTFCGCIDEIRTCREIGIALDLEASAAYVPYNSPESVKLWCCNLIKALHDKYQRPVICYMGDLYPDHWYSAFKEAGAVFWIAKWGCSEKNIKHDCHFWQFTSRYNGMNLDADYTMKDPAECARVLCFPTAENAISTPVAEEPVVVTPQVENTTKVETKSHIDEATHLAAVNAMALAVIDGHYGNGPERKEKLYNAIQGRVNELVKAGVV